jgi:hypothetical protein
MTTFDDRKDAYEKKYVHDQEEAFKIHARRNKLLGLWAAKKMGMKTEDHEAYAKEVVAADFEEPGDADLLAKLTKDFEQAGISISEREIREEMHALQTVARDQIHNG